MKKIVSMTNFFEKDDDCPRYKTLMEFQNVCDKEEKKIKKEKK